MRVALGTVNIRLCMNGNVQFFERQWALVDWSVIVLPVVICSALVVLPGLFIAVGAGQKGFDALALSLPISVGVVGMSAIVAPLIGLEWSLAVPLMSGLLFALPVGLAVYTLRRTRWWDIPTQSTLTSAPLEQQKWWGLDTAYCLLGVALGTLLLGWRIVYVLGSPETIGQSFDEIFHLNAVRYIADHGNASSFFVGTMTVNADSSFYPAAWHAIPALVLGSAHDSVMVAVNSMALVVGALVWPISVMYMVRHTVATNAVSTVGTGILSASFIAFPFSLMRWGILYPNNLGIALIPIGIGLAAQFFRLGKRRTLSTVQGIVLGGFVCLGTALAHPNAVLTLLVLCVPMVVVRIVLQVRSAREGQLGWPLCSVQVLALVAGLAVLGYLWTVMRPDIEAGRHWVPELTAPQAIGEGLMNGGMNTGALWVASILILIGLYRVLRQNDKNLWLVGMWLVAMFFFVAIRHLEYDEGRYEITGVWYQDSYRVAAFMPVVAIPLAAMGLYWVSQKLVDTVYPLVRQWVAPWGVWCATALLVCIPLAYYTQSTAAYTAYLEELKTYYTMTDTSPRLSPDELELLEEIKGRLPEGSTIVVNPADGGAYAYAIADYRVTSMHIITDVTADEQILEKRFDDAATDPAVCPAMQRESAYYALDFIPAPGAQKKSGFDELAVSPGMTELYRVGDAALYRADICL